MAFSFHQICDTSTAGCDPVFSWSPELFSQFTQWLAAQQASGAIQVKTVQQVIGGAEQAPVTSYPAVSPAPYGTNALANSSLSDGLSVTGSPNPAPSAGGNVTYSVNVQEGATTPTGTVVVSDGNGGSCEIRSLTAGSGSCVVDEAPSPDPYLVSATYSGDANYSAQSPTLTGTTLENVDATTPAAAPAATPECWTPESFGTNTPAYSWSTTGGVNGGGEETINLSNVQGAPNEDANLATSFDLGQCAPPALTDHAYTLSVYYESSVPVYFKLYGQSSVDHSWSTWTQSPTFPATNTWTLATWTSPAVPSSINGLSFGMTINANGTLSTSDYSLVDSGPVVPAAAPIGTNALNNPLLTSGSGNSPTCWTVAGYGSNSPTSTWSATGGANNSGEETITMANLNSGDAKLVTNFDNGACAPTVTVGDSYTLSAYYESSVPVFFTLYGRNPTTGAWGYWTQSPTFPATNTWTLATWTAPAVPSSINGVSFGMTINANGTLSTSDYSLVDGGAGVPPAAPIGTNALSNPLLTSGSGNSPTCWTVAGYGDNSPTSTWSATGGANNSGEETITMANLNSGDAKLVTNFDNGACAPTVTVGDAYTLSTYYESSVPVFFTLYGRNPTTGAWGYWTQSPTFPATNTWTLATWTAPAVPSSINGVSFGMTINANGTLSTSDYSLVDSGPVVPAAAPIGTNALNNPLLTSGSGNSPTCWTVAGYGSNSPTSTWSATGGANNSGEETITMANLNSGDAKLVTNFDNGACAPTVTVGDSYTLSAYYESSVPVFFTLYGRNPTTGAWGYWTQSPTFPATNTWTLATWTAPAVPSSINGVSFGMTINANGTLSTSDYSLVDGGAGVPPAAPIGTNALSNPLLTSGSGNSPTCWTVAGYGSNSPTSTWSATGGANNSGEETITMANLNSGDAKLVTNFDNGACAPTVTVGDSYTLSAYYESSVPVFFTLYGRNPTTGAWGYWTQSPTFPATNTWTLATWTAPAVPSSINGVSFGMTINANGTLSTSDYSLVDGGAGVPPAAPIGTNALSNPLLTSGSGNSPTCWTVAGYGSNSPTSTWSATGGANNSGEETITMANLNSGDAKLVTNFDNGACAPTVTVGDSYTLSAYYESSVPVFFTLYGRNPTTGAWGYWTQSPTFPATNTWTLATWTSPAVPSSINGLSFGMTINANGTLSTSDYSLVDGG